MTVFKLSIFILLREAENQIDKYMENEMDTGIILGLYKGYIGIMEKKMETTIMGYIGYNIGVILEGSNP